MSLNQEIKPSGSCSLIGKASCMEDLASPKQKIGILSLTKSLSFIIEHVLFLVILKSVAIKKKKKRKATKI